MASRCCGPLLAELFCCCSCCIVFIVCVCFCLKFSILRDHWRPALWSPGTTRAHLGFCAMVAQFVKHTLFIGSAWRRFCCFCCSKACSLSASSRAAILAASSLFCASSFCCFSSSIFICSAAAALLLPPVAPIVVEPLHDFLHCSLRNSFSASGLLRCRRQSRRGLAPRHWVLWRDIPLCHSRSIGNSVSVDVGASVAG